MSAWLKLAAVGLSAATLSACATTQNPAVPPTAAQQELAGRINEDCLANDPSQAGFFRGLTGRQCYEQRQAMLQGEARRQGQISQNLSSEVASLRNRRTARSSELANQQAALAQARSDIARLRSDLAAFETRNQTLRTERTRLQAELTVVEAEISALEALPMASPNELAALERRREELQAEITALLAMRS